MKIEEAKQIIESAINQGVIKGVYNLQDVVQIIQALEFMYRTLDQKEVGVKETEK